MTVLIEKAAQQEIEALPLTMQRPIATVFERLARWPAISGAKPLRGELAGT